MGGGGPEGTEIAGRPHRQMALKEHGADHDILNWHAHSPPVARGGFTHGVKGILGQSHLQ